VQQPIVNFLEVHSKVGKSVHGGSSASSSHKVMKPAVGRRIGSTRVAILLGIMLIGAATLCVEARLGPASTTTTPQSHTKELEHSIPRFSTARWLRRLQRLTGFGREPDADDLPLPICAGDCDNDDEVSRSPKRLYACVFLALICCWLDNACIIV
jgi:hypothetical protein